MLCAILLTSVSLLSIIKLSRRILSWNEVRPDLVCLNDPWLPLFPRFDTSIIISLVSIANFAVIIFHIARHLDFEIMCLHNLSLAFMLSMRLVFLASCPLRIHSSAVPIKDNLIDRFASAAFQNDLMFSGHVGHCSLAWFLFPELRTWFGSTIVIVVASLLLNKAHYCIDMLVAPLAAFAAQALAKSCLSQ